MCHAMTFSFCFFFLIERQEVSKDTQSAGAGEVQLCWLQEPTPLPAQFLWSLLGWALLCASAHSHTECTFSLPWRKHLLQEHHDDSHLPVWPISLPDAWWRCHGPPIPAGWWHSQVLAVTEPATPLLVARELSWSLKRLELMIPVLDL